ncbi:MAG: hypothetical protein QOE33_2932 [Acidobacteriota bacterium]|nr:hypothetical protein [Acidobacteriota bacterium]
MNVRFDSTLGAARASVASLVALSLVLGLAPFASAQVRGSASSSSSKARKMTEDQRASHVLNRLAFGARPGDAERVRKLGVEKYIEQQLHPELIDDAAAEARLTSLEVLKMSNGELLAKYPQPNFLLKQMQREGKLPSDLKDLRDNRKTPADAAAANTTNKQLDANASMSASGAQPNAQAATNPSANAQGQTPNPLYPNAQTPVAVDPNRAEYRQAVAEFYREHGLQQPQKVTAELQASRIMRAVYSERQLQEVMVDFWTNHFNVYAPKGADRWFLVSYDRDVIRPHAFGNFKDLLVATAESPAMLFYLDNFQSVSPTANQNQRRAAAARFNQNPMLNNALGVRRDRMPQQPGQMPVPQRQKRGINENYARELMELHTLGVDGGYTQKDVQEVARCFTGWTIIDPRGAANYAGFVDEARTGTFYFNPRLHDDGEKLVLGHKIPAGGGINDGMMVLDILAHHPSTAKFIATKLSRKFVSDNPTPELVGRVAAAYMKSNGDIRETLRAIFTSPEFNSPENYRAKIKTPFELAVSAVRALGGDTNGAPPIHQWIGRMGEPLYQYQAPTGYPDTAEHWVNTGALLERINFALALVSNRIPGTHVDLSRFGADTSKGTTADKSRVIDEFAAVIMQGDISPKTKASLLKQLDEVATNPQESASASMPASNMSATGAAKMNAATDTQANAMDAPAGGRRGLRGQLAANNNNNAPASEIARIAALLLGSPEFQRQ